jgi:tRNA-dihydrouridine synthase
MTDSAALLDRRFTVAPMMDWTDRHCRAFHRVLTRRAVLYTEMAVDQAVIHGDAPRLIGFDRLRASRSRSSWAGLIPRFWRKPRKSPRASAISKSISMWVVRPTGFSRASSAPV